MNTVSDRLHTRLEALGRVQARYSWWLVVASVFFLALHTGVRDCEDMPGSLRDALAIVHSPAPPPAQPATPAGAQGEPEAEDEEAPPSCAASVLVVPVVGLPLSQLAIWAAGPAFLGLLALIFMGSLIAAAEAGKALGYIEEFGEVPIGFIDTVPNGIDLAFVFHPALWKKDSIWKKAASFKYQLFIVIILAQAGLLWVYSAAVFRGEIVEPFLGQLTLLVAGAIAVLAAAGRTGYLIWRRATRAARSSWERRLRRLAANHAIDLERVTALADEIRRWLGQRSLALDDAQLEAVVSARLALEGRPGQPRSSPGLDEATIQVLLVDTVAPPAEPTGRAE